MSRSCSSVSPTSGPRHQRAEGERVARVRESPGEREEVLHLLASEEALARLRGDRQVFFFQSAFVVPEIGPGRGKQRDAPWGQGREFPLLVAHMEIPNETGAKLRDGLRLRLSGGLRAGHCVDLDLRRARQAMVHAADGRRKGYIPGLSRHGQRGFEASVNVREY